MQVAKWSKIFMNSLFDQINQQYDDNLLEGLFKAYFDARKNKRNKYSSLDFEFNFESNLIKLYKSIKNGTYKPLPSIAFISTKPVIREVFSANFRDRVVHHLIFNNINHIFEKDFIENSYSCRKNKGTLHGANKIYDFIYECSNKYTKDSYILKLDIKGYFYSINQDRLYSIITNKLNKNDHDIPIGYDYINKLIKEIIYNDATKNVYKFRDDKNWRILPKDKSLFYTKNNHGLAIGNLTSQLFSNIYMNIFDKYITNTLGLKYYGRYVDDFILIHNDKEYLKSLIPKIKDFLLLNLGLILHPKKIYLQHHTKGVKFLGSYLKPNVKYIDKRTKDAFYKLIEKINVEFPSNKYNKVYVEKIRAQINSYLGIMIHFSSFKLRKKIICSLDKEFFKFFGVDIKYSKVVLY